MRAGVRSGAVAAAGASAQAAIVGSYGTTRTQNNDGNCLTTLLLVYNYCLALVRSYLLLSHRRGGGQVGADDGERGRAAVQNRLAPLSTTPDGWRIYFR